MILRDFLKKYTNVGEIVVLRENGWDIGITRIDNDDLYLDSLHPRLLNLYEVINFAYEQRDWATKCVLFLDILPASEVSEYVRKRMVSR